MKTNLMPLFFTLAVFGMRGLTTRAYAPPADGSAEPQ